MPEPVFIGYARHAGNGNVWNVSEIEYLDRVSCFDPYFTAQDS